MTDDYIVKVAPNVLAISLPKKKKFKKFGTLESSLRALGPIELKLGEMVRNNEPRQMQKFWSDPRDDSNVPKFT